MKKLLIFALILTLALCVAACDKTPEETPTEAPTEAVTDAPTEEATTEEATTEEVTTEEATTEEATTEEVTTEEVTTEEPAEPAEPTALYTAEQLAALTATNATVTLEGEYAHFLTGTADTMTNPSITLTAEGEGGFTDIIAIKYRTNCGSYGSNFWGTFLLNGTNEFYGNRRDSDNWFFYYTDGEWDVLILDMRKHKQGSDGTPDTDVTGGAAIESLVYNFFDYAGNDGKLTTADGGEEYFDIEYIAFFNTKEEAQSYAG